MSTFDKLAWGNTMPLFWVNSMTRGFRLGDRVWGLTTEGALRLRRNQAPPMDPRPFPKVLVVKRTLGNVGPQGYELVDVDTDHVHLVMEPRNSLLGPVFEHTEYDPPPPKVFRRMPWTTVVRALDWG